MSELDYRINDADNHFNEPPDCFERYIDPDQVELAIRSLVAPDGSQIQLFAGRPSKFTSAASHQITFSGEELEHMLGDTTNVGVGRTSAAAGGPAELEVVPGMLLNRLNPLKGLSEVERHAFIEEFRSRAEAFGNRDLRLALMDEQGIDKALMFPAAAHDIEYEFADRVDALYANIRAFNRWMHEEVGFISEGRMWLPPYISFADPELAVRELELVMAQGANVIQTKSGHAHGGRNNPFGGRSLADPVFDRFWSICNEAGVRLAVHLGGTDYQKYSADWSEDPDAVFYDFNAFQWVNYWGDRPAMELTSALVLQNFFGRFPNMKVCLSEQGTVWVPYTIRKMDHAFLMGRKASFSETARLDQRPSEIFRQHFVVAPFPEENVQRVVAEVGIEPIVFGSDFPHGEGLAYPAAYADAQLASFSPDDVRTIMRDNLENFLVGAIDADSTADREFLGLELDPSGVGRVDITYKLMSPRGSFYGGAGLALACAMMEHATARDTVWCTVQFASGAAHGERIKLESDVVAHGHRTSQVRVTARVDGREVFTSVGATGAAGGRTTRTFASMPSVSPPEESTPASVPAGFDREKTHFGTTEIREAIVHGGNEGSATPSMAIWARIDGTPTWTPTLLGYVADVVPMSIHRVLGARQPGGMSLDNSLRVGPRVDTDWLLLALHAEAAHEGYGHGSVHLFSPDGVLAGVASQTFALRSPEAQS